MVDPQDIRRGWCGLSIWLVLCAFCFVRWGWWIGVSMLFPNFAFVVIVLPLTVRFTIGFAEEWLK